MSLGDGEMHVLSGVGIGVLAGGLVVLMVITAIDHDPAQAARDPLDDMDPIEASIAYKKSPAKQPQKKFRPPDPDVKPQGVRKDDTKPDPLVKKKPEEKKSKDKPPPNYKPPDRREKDDTLPVNEKPVTDVGEFNDNKRGFADVTAGDPFFRELAADFHEIWSWPEFVKSEATAAACLHIKEDGKIEKTKIDPRSGEPQLDESLAAGLKLLQKKRNDNPIAVPSHLLKSATTRWICFRAKTPQSQ